MIAAPHTVSHTQVKSSAIGVMYDMETTVIPGGCSNCTATGQESFDTPEDIAASEAWCNSDCGCDPDDVCECSPPDGLSGRRECPKCHGTGVCEDDGLMVMYKMKYTGSVAV